MFLSFHSLTDPGPGDSVSKPRRSLSLEVIAVMKLKRFVGVALATLALGTLALPALAQQTLTGYTGEVKLQGSVTGSNEAEVRAYVNGLLRGSTTSGPTGDYEITFELDGAVDQTAVVWFIPDNETKVPEIVLVKESSAARRNGVWSPCLKRLKAGDIVIHNVNFLTQRELFSSLEENTCWDE